MAISTHSAIGFSVISRYVTLALQFVSTMVLARLLTPEDIGIYTAGFSIVAFAHLFRDFGLNQYLIQEKELTQDKIRATFFLSIGIAWSLGLMVYLSASLAAQFFNEPGVKLLLELLSINFFIIPFGAITLAILRKNLKFHITAFITFVSALLSIAVAIYTAMNGAKYLCLAYAAITETVVTVLLALLFRPKGLPILPSLKGSKAILKFGSVVGLANIINQFSTSLTDILIARFLGLTALGFFSRAFGAFSLFDHLIVSSIHSTILPLFAKENKNNQALANAYLKSVEYTFIFAWPFFTFLFLYTDEVIQVLYGDQWGPAVPLVKILCLGGLLLPPTLFIDNLFVAFGKPGITLKIQIYSNLLKILLIVPACFIGLKALAMAIVGYICSRLVLTLFYSKQQLQVKAMDFAQCGFKALVSLITAILPTIILYPLLSRYIGNIFIELPLLAIACFAGWLTGLAVGKHQFYFEIIKLIKKPDNAAVK